MDVESPAVLVVGRDAAGGREITEALSALQVSVGSAQGAGETMRELETCAYDAVVVDLDAPGAGALIDSVANSTPDVPLILLGDPGAISHRSGLRTGATDLLARPFSQEQLVRAVSAQLSKLGRIHPTPFAVESLTSKSRAMQQVADLVRRAAPGSATVLLRGESGTGKDVVAHAIHEQSSRRDRPFVKVHCAGLPDTLLESELFGYERGAFTGAVSRKPGRVELAQDGTLFLDEIGDITLSMQVKLLRLLQDRAYERLGGSQTLATDVRFIAATHRDLDRMIGRGEFREDLFYRLNVLPIWLPSLRARREDIEPLANAFCARFARDNHKPGMRLSPEAVEHLRVQRWPGNVRQLQNLIERLVVLCDGPAIGIEEVQREIADHGPFSTQTLGKQATPAEGSADQLIAEPSASEHGAETGDLGAFPSRLADHLRAAERTALVQALAHTGGSRSVAARILGIGRTTLYNKLLEHGLGK